MYRSDIEIQEGALFVSDAHFNKPKGEDSFLSFLKHISQEQHRPPQLFLLGDIFDALFGGVPYTAVANEEAIELIEKIAADTQVVYLEGNHDFRLHSFFSKNVKIFPLKQQPLLCKARGKRVLLAHGDYDAPFGYRAYTALIRNPVVLFFLNIYDSLTNHSILNFVEKHMSKKEQCREFEWFDDFVKKRVQKGLACDVYIDGHFHQNKSYRFNTLHYINLGAFACNQRYFVVKFIQDEIRLEEHTLAEGV